MTPLTCLFAPALAFLLMTQQVFAIYKAESKSGHLNYEILSWATPGEWTIKSPDFPLPYQLSSEIYIYNVTNTEKQGKIRLTFDDFVLHPSSVIKIYDGSSYQTTWLNDERPFYQSEGRTLTLVFKPGQVTEYEAIAHPHPYYVGFTAKFSFVSEPRNTWLETTAPATGCCGGSGSAGWHGTTSLPCDCIWSRSLDDAHYVSIVLPSVDWIKDDKVIVRYHGGTSQSLEVPLSSWKVLVNGILVDYGYHGNLEDDGGQVLVLGPTSTFYIRLNATIKPGQMMTFASASSIPEAIGLATSYRPRQSYCPYKACDSVTKAVCVATWERCDHNTGSSTEWFCTRINGVQRKAKCDGGSRCYDKQHDTCDDWNDCDDQTDELNCHDDLWTFLSQRKVIGTLAGLVIFWVVVVSYQRWYHQRAHRRHHADQNQMATWCCLKKTCYDRSSDSSSSNNSRAVGSSQAHDQDITRGVTVNNEALQIVSRPNYGMDPPPAYNEAYLQSDSELSTISTSDGANMTSQLSVHGERSTTSLPEVGFPTPSLLQPGVGFPTTSLPQPVVGLTITSLPQPPSYEETLANIQNTEKPNSPPPPYDSIT